MKNKKIFILISIFLLQLFFFLNSGFPVENEPELSVFYSPSCRRCLKVEKEILPKIEEEFKGKIKVLYYDVTNSKNYAYLLGLRERFNKNITLDLPLFFINGNLINGKGDVKTNLSQIINIALSLSSRNKEVKAIDLVSRFESFKPLTVAGAGLIDGVNPCAFTVIVFFISYLAFQGYKKVELAIIGVAFIFTVFLTYLMIGLGVFNFLYQLNTFWIIARIFNILIGVFSLILGILALYDFFKFKKTRDTDGLLLQLPKVIKNQIHRVIGMHYRKSKEEGLQDLSQPVSLGKLLLSALVTGFLVTLLEAVCTGQLYLPTITFIFKSGSLKLKAFFYLILYNIMFVMPLFVIFIMALLGVTSKQFAEFIKKQMLVIKIIMAIFFIGLGVFLVWRA